MEITLGPAIGNREGNAGTTDGLMVGIVGGITYGCVLGQTEGMMVGKTVGVAEGPREGRKLSPAARLGRIVDGTAVGTVVGAADRLIVKGMKEAVGVTLGNVEGIIVDIKGLTDGLAVGDTAG